MADELLQELKENPVWITKKVTNKNPTMARCAAEMIYFSQLAPGFCIHENTEVLKIACEKYLKAYNKHNQK
jgi:hypothetical protein